MDFSLVTGTHVPYLRRSNILDRLQALAARICLALMVPMASFMRLSTKRSCETRNFGISAPSRLLISLCLLVTASCSAQRHAHLSDAAIDSQSGTLTASLDLDLSRVHIEALEHGVPLVLVFTLTPVSGQQVASRWRLSYLPMSRRYELLVDQASPRYFPSRVQLIASLDRVRFPLANPGLRTGTLRMHLDVGALPAALRLPALFDSNWWLRSETIRWGATS